MIRKLYLGCWLTLAALSACNSGSGSSSGGEAVTLGAPGAPAGSPAAAINSTTKTVQPVAAGADATAATPLVWYRQCDPVGCHANQSGAACTAEQLLGASCGTAGDSCVLNSCGDLLVCGVNSNQVNCGS